MDGLKSEGSLLYDSSYAAWDGQVAEINPQLEGRVGGRCYWPGYMIYMDKAARNEVQRDFAEFAWKAIVAQSAQQPWRSRHIDTVEPWCPSSTADSVPWVYERHEVMAR